MSVNIERRSITPEQAADWLENNNKNNRSVSKSTVTLYARLMSEGKWDFNGETIQFDVNGNLINGQHRLLAVVASGVELDALVVSGLPVQAKDSIDQQRKRTPGDVLKMHGYPNGNKIAGIARLVNAWDMGHRGAGLIGGSQTALAPTEVLALVEADPLILPAAVAASSVAADVLAPARAYGTLWVLTHRVDPDFAEEFFRRLTTGEMLEAGHPVLTLRRYWTNLSKRSTTNRRIRVSTAYDHLHSGVRAWNAAARGEKLQTIVWKNHTIPELVKPKLDEDEATKPVKTVKNKVSA